MSMVSDIIRDGIMDALKSLKPLRLEPVDVGVQINDTLRTYPVTLEPITIRPIESPADIRREGEPWRLCHHCQASGPFLSKNLARRYVERDGLIHGIATSDVVVCLRCGKATCLDPEGNFPLSERMLALLGLPGDAPAAPTTPAATPAPSQPLPPRQAPQWPRPPA